MKTIGQAGLFLIAICAGWTAHAGPAEPVALDWAAVQEDWALQDGFFDNGNVQLEAIRRVVDEVGAAAGDLRSRYDALSSTSPGDPRWIKLYRDACRARRQARLAPFLDRLGRVVFTKHYNLGGSHYAYTENLTDTQHLEAARTNSDYRMGASLCLLEVHQDGTATHRTLLEAPKGVIRDPDVSYDGRRILFAMRHSADRDDYHLYEMEVASGTVRQLTFGAAVADYEGQYLPGGDIVFNSTRPVQTVDCFSTEVSNLYTCDGDGNYLRRLSFDQVHTNYPTVTPDGRVIYTRWDYADRGQIFPQGLFQMNPDGTAQTELYGNNSWFPTTILHARAIPGTRQIVAIFTGHHTHQRGQLGILDPGQGRQENQGARLIAPERETAADRIDTYGQTGPQFQYPYPLGKTAFLVAMDPLGSRRGRYERPYGIYWIDCRGRRELLAIDPQISCNQPVPLVRRSEPNVQPSKVDYAKTQGTFYMQDAYVGPGLAGVPRGTVKKLRVVTFTYRAAPIRHNYNKGPAGKARSSTPVSIGGGCWDPKIILGDATVHADGSACFHVPARTPVYFQSLNEKGHAVQTMRSWSTLQPGEQYSCVGCHESKNSSPPSGAPTLAMRHGPQVLEPFYGPPRGFSFAKEIQPILDRHCTRCHNDRAQAIDWERPVDRPVDDEGKAFSLLGTTTTEELSGRRWSDAYLALCDGKLRDLGIGNKRSLMGRPNRLVRWIGIQEGPAMLPPYFAGAARSGLIPLLEGGHGGAQLDRQELDKIAAWIDLLIPYCGDYMEANAWTEDELRTYRHFLDKRRRLQQIERGNIKAFIERCPDSRTPCPSATGGGCSTSESSTPAAS